MMYATCDVLIPDVINPNQSLLLDNSKTILLSQVSDFDFAQSLTNYTLANLEIIQYCFKCTYREACTMICTKSSLNSSLLWSLNHFHKCGTSFSFGRRILDNNPKQYSELSPSSDTTDICSNIIGSFTMKKFLKEEKRLFTEMVITFLT